MFPSAAKNQIKQAAVEKNYAGGGGSVGAGLGISYCLGVKSKTVTNRVQLGCACNISQPFLWGEGLQGSPGLQGPPTSVV